MQYITAFNKINGGRMTFNNSENEVKYKKYNPSRCNIKRQILFERDVAEEINKIKEVLRIKSNVLVGSSVIVDIGMRYFFQYLEDIGDDDALELLIKGVLLKL